MTNIVQSAVIFNSYGFFFERALQNFAEPSMLG
jgi:hypothetical protein